MMWPPYPICLDTSKHEDVDAEADSFGTQAFFVLCPCSQT